MERISEYDSRPNNTPTTAPAPKKCPACLDSGVELGQTGAELGQDAVHAGNAVLAADALHARQAAFHVPIRSGLRLQPVPITIRNYWQKLLI